MTKTERQINTNNTKTNTTKAKMTQIQRRKERCLKERKIFLSLLSPVRRGRREQPARKEGWEKEKGRGGGDKKKQGGRRGVIFFISHIFPR
jgi:hypothetical protein